MAGSKETAETRWLLLIHQIPPKPNYFRVKIGRRLQRLGAAAIKNSVYVLPRTDQAQEDFEWVAREIVKGGGEASVCEARFVDGLSDIQIEGLFNSGREADFLEITQKAREALGSRRKRKFDDAERGELESALARLRRRLSEISAIDFFGANGSQAAEAALAEIAERLRPTVKASEPDTRPAIAAKDARRRVWVTRRGIHVDRMASAWLIRRFIDAEARFKFVAPKGGYEAEEDELRFDMFEAEFTHDGDRCTFEVLLREFDLGEAALKAIGEIVHDIDLKDSKFSRPDTVGVERLINGIAMANKEDEARLSQSSTVFDGLYEFFRKKRV